MTAAYIPQAGSIAERAIAHLRLLPADAEIASGALADALAVKSSFVNVCLDTAAKRGAVIREKREGRIFWKLGLVALLQSAPPVSASDDHEAPEPGDHPLKRIVPATESSSLAGLRAQSWCSVVPEGTGSLDETPAPPPSPPAPPPGLGWRAPGTPVPFADALTPAPVDAPGPARAPEPFLTAASFNHETLHALSTALAPQPEESLVVDAEFDPDFLEVPSAAVDAPRDPVHIHLLPPDAPAGARAAPRLPLDEGAFRCALWSDGRLHVETHPGMFLLLTKGETRHLVRYLDRMREPAE